MSKTQEHTDNPQPSRNLLRLLIVDDSAADADLTLTTLKRAGYLLSFDVVSSPELFQQKVTRNDYDIIISDHNLDSWSGMEALEFLKQSGKEIPFIISTGTIGDEAAVEYIKRGAADYVLKRRIERLPLVVGRALRERAHREETHRFHEQMLAAKRNWELTFDSVPDPVFLLDGRCCVQRANRSAVDVFGIPFSELIGKHCFELLSCRGATRDDCPHKRLVQSGKIERGDLEEIRLGKVFDMTCSPLRDPRGAVQGCVVVLHDITDRRKAEAHIRLQAAALESAANVIVITNRQGEITWVNPAFTQLTGYSFEEALGKNPRILKSGVQTQGTYEEMWETIVAGRVWHGEITNRRKDGSLYEEEMTITPVRDANGEISHFIAIKQDVSARKRAADEIRKLNEDLEKRVRDRTRELELANCELNSRRLEAERASKFKDQFLSTMSHELRTPLNAVLGFSELLSDETYGPLNECQRRYLGHIRVGGQHLVRLVSEVLDLSRIEAGRLELVPEDFAIEPVVAEALETVRALMEKKSLHISLAVEPGLMIHADPTRFRQVLFNLLGNAIKFTPNGGQIHLKAFLKSELVRLEVYDSGPGIPPEEQGKIFEAFYRMNQGDEAAEGTGLGLAITQRLVELQGGRLGLQSEVGKGSCFFFTMPAVLAARKAGQPNDLADAPLDTSPLVLVVEHDSDAAHSIETQLGWAGYRVAVCKDSRDAMQQAIELNPSAITLDILTKPVSSWEVLSSLRKDPRTQHIPVIATSVADAQGAGISLRVDEYLPKPIQQKSLLAAIERCFDQRGVSLPVRPILVVEDNTATRELLTQMLSANGYAVAAAKDGQQARAIVEATLPELVLLDLLLPQLNGFDLLTEWRANPRTAEMPVFVLSGLDLTAEETMLLRRYSELLLRKQESWQSTLLGQLRRVLNTEQRMAV